MITLPISKTDLTRMIMVRVPAAGVRFTDDRLQEAIEDQALGLCEFAVRRTEIKSSEQVVYDLDGSARTHTTTTQSHHVEICYQDPELEFMKKLEWGLV